MEAYDGGDVLPPGGADDVDRAARGTGTIRDGDATVRSCAAYEWQWGGTWTSHADPHFSKRAAEPGAGDSAGVTPRQIREESEPGPVDGG